MKVKPSELRNQLSRYLKRVRQTGDCITVMDRNRPIAVIRPYADHPADTRTDVWVRRARVEAELGGLDEDIELPARRTVPAKHLNPLD
jgi:prevent-host-death family protein